MAQTYININGEMRDASSLTLPPEGRLLRGAWVFNGDVVEIDPVLLMVKRVIRDPDKIIVDPLFFAPFHSEYYLQGNETSSC